MTQASPEAAGSADLAPRYAAALAALDLQPGHDVLEIGCGHGVLVGPLCDAVGPDGVVHALDRSPKMIAAASARNVASVEAGRARLHAGRVQDVALEHDAFDRVVAVRVRALWDDAGATLPRVAGWLRPGGRLCLVIDGPDEGRVGAAVSAAASAISSHGFTDALVERAGRHLVVVSAGR